MESTPESPQNTPSAIAPVQVCFRWTVEEALKAQRLSLPFFLPGFRRFRLGCGIFMIFYSAHIFSVVYDNFSALDACSFEASPFDWLLPLIGLLLLLLGIQICLAFFGRSPIQNRLLRRNFLKDPQCNSAVEWSISEEVFHIQTDKGSSEIKWAAFSKVIELPEGFLFFSNPRIFQWMPKHGFASEADFQRLSQMARVHAAQFRRVKK